MSPDLQHKEEEEEEEKKPLLGGDQTASERGRGRYSLGQRCKTMTTKRLVCYGLLIGLAFLLVLGSLIGLPAAMAAIYKFVINMMMQLDPDSPLFAEWVTPDIPMFQSFYFYDIQNPVEFKAGGKPNVTQKGPYVYRLEFDRLNLTFYDNGTLSFYPKYLYYFDEEKSVGPETDSFIILNMPLVTVAYFVRDSGFIIQEGANALMNTLGERLTINLTVNELLWGYEEPLFKLIQPIIRIPGFDQGQFGFLIGFNDTTNHLYTVHDGKANQSLLNWVENYQGVPELPWWWTEETNEIQGTDGTMYHPYMSRKEKLYLFHPDLCRSVPYIYEEDVVYKEVPLLKFVLANYTFYNGSDYPPNEGFCKGNHDLCGPSGIMRQDPCRFGSPSSISNPHFFQGDPALYEAVDGLDPKAKYHQHYMEIEPLMGMPYILKMRLQINMALLPVKYLDEVKHVRHMTMPVLWFEQSVEANDEIVNYYKTGFVLTAYIANIVKWVLVAFGILCFLLTTYSISKRIAYPPGMTPEKDGKIINGSEEDGCVSGSVNGSLVQDTKPASPVAM